MVSRDFSDRDSFKEYKDNPLHKSWYDTAQMGNIYTGKVLDYFSEKTNPFYDRQCNNEIIKMQRLNRDELHNMTGIEYKLLHSQDPILYVIRKLMRQGPEAAQEFPIAHYHIIGGKVYQSPDLGSIINSRLTNTAHYLESALEEAQSYSRYNSSTGYSWEFKSKDQNEKLKEKERKKKPKREEPSSSFQRQRVDVLLSELARKFPPKMPTTNSNVADHQQPERPGGEGRSGAESGSGEETLPVTIKTEMKRERDDGSYASVETTSRPPAEKKAKIMR